MLTLSKIKGRIVCLLFGAAAMLIIVVGTHQVMEYTSANDFCLNCHEMQTAYKEYVQSPHYSNRSGVVAACHQCHLPQTYPAKLLAKFSKITEVYYHMLGRIDTTEKYEGKRAAMAEKVWSQLRRNGSKPCTLCHNYESMLAAKQGLHARKAHARAMDSGGEKSCVDCHRGVAHGLPKTTDSARKNGIAGLCLSCHQQRHLFSPSHPTVETMDLVSCLACHRQMNHARENFKQFMHTSHRDLLDCKVCHESGVN
ncbi:MAG: NapC/NirT family cytochrome c [Gammaproteobacteria bacterium]|nr:NapC/NirT family cytochrome c [Gammaproteobacteria bacterium]MDH5800677.1 NapC/NirT family cytochrome c [Gammaproteobacteria bacterium]